MRYLPILTLFLSFFLFSKNSDNYNLQQDEKEEKNKKALDFPIYANFWDSIGFFECNDILLNTPKSFNFEIYEDTIIDLHQFDNRIDIKLKFNWLYKKIRPNNKGVTSINVIENQKIISSIELNEIIGLEAFRQDNPKSRRYDEAVRDDIYMVDVNLDSYFDIKMRTQCGQSCWYSYWIFNKKNNTFERNESLDSFRPYYYDCKNQIIYSYEGGSAWNSNFSAYKIINNQIHFLQSRYYERGEEYSLFIYRDANEAIISSDTIFNKEQKN